MNPLAREFAQAIEETLRENGVDTWDIDLEGKHKKYRFHFNGKDLVFVTPLTPSDQRGWMNAVSDLRRMMGVRRQIHKSPIRREKTYRKPQNRARLVVPKITVLPDPWEKLREMEVVNVCKEPAADLPVRYSPLRRVLLWAKGMIRGRQ